MSIILREILSYLFRNFHSHLQFMLPFIVALVRELDKRITAKLVTKIMKEQDNPATVLTAILVCSRFSFLVAVRLVNAELSTLICTVAIDFLLHLIITYRIINEYRKSHDLGIGNKNTERNAKITMLVIAELIEGLTPIIYGMGLAMAYHGPNYHLFSKVGNNYWNEEMKSIGPLFIIMAILFGIDTLSVFVNFICLWKVMRVNMFFEIRRVLIKYWHFMAFYLAYNGVAYFATRDINFGIDDTMKFQWISNEGWMRLVNNSNVLTDVEKVELLTETTSDFSVASVFL